MKLKSLTSSLLIAAILSTMIFIKGVSDPLNNTEVLTEDLEYTTGVFDGGDRQEEHYVTYHPGGNVKPFLWYGMTALGDRTVFETAAFQAEADGRRVLAGINGDYFVLSSGQPVGIVISEGKLISSDDGNPALGFQEDGSAFFGTPQLLMELRIRGSEYRISGINRAIRSDGFYLYTSDFGGRTSASKETMNVILVPEDNGILSVGNEINLRVESICPSEGSISIPEDRMVLSLTADSEEWRIDTAESLSIGEELTLRITSADPRWETCTYATGSLYRLITDNEIAQDLDRIDRTSAPRTAVGIREDGSVLFYTIDGRQPAYSAGLSLQELALRLQALGCVNAGALDGGGSTVLYAQSAGDEDPSVRSRPSNGKEREVSTFLMLVSEGESSGEARTLSVRSSTAVLLCGGQAQFMAGQCDEKGAPVSNPGFTWSASDGRITSDGLYSAPEYACRAKICAMSGALQGNTEVEVIRTPDSIRILAQDSGEELTRLELQRSESADLTAAAVWGLMEINAADEQFTWSCSGNAGEIDETGRFTASNNGGSGTITVSVGDASMTIGVFVKTTYTCIQDFEGFENGSADGITWSGESRADRVRFGENSLRMDYVLDHGEAVFPIQLNHSEQAQYLFIWVYGDGSGNTLSARFGNSIEPLTTLDFSGWKLLQKDTGCRGLDALCIQGKGTGSMWIDQALISNNDVPDLEPPEIEMDAYGTLVTAKIIDRADGYIEADALRLTIDGKDYPFVFDPVSGTLKADADDDGQMHRITLSAADLSGNLISASVMLQGTIGKPFADMNGHWAEEYAGYLYGRGIIAGRESPEGLLFDPNTPVTRAEFAVMLSRWLELSGSNAELQTFADAGQIPAWARDGVCAVIGHGLIQGEQEGSTLWFKPMEPLTRAQAATILGRTLAGGRPFADLVFADTDAIPEWASKYVSLMCYMGVLNGFEDGTFRPDGTLTRAQAAKLLTMMS